MTSILIDFGGVLDIASFSHCQDWRPSLLLFDIKGRCHAHQLTGDAMHTSADAMHINLHLTGAMHINSLLFPNLLSAFIRLVLDVFQLQFSLLYM